jgi:hypothetical protein
MPTCHTTKLHEPAGRTSAHACIARTYVLPVRTADRLSIIEVVGRAPNRKEWVVCDQRHGRRPERGRSAREGCNADKCPLRDTPRDRNTCEIQCTRRYMRAKTRNTPAPLTNERLSIWDSETKRVAQQVESDQRRVRVSQDLGAAAGEAATVAVACEDAATRSTPLASRRTTRSWARVGDTAGQ